MLEIGNLLNIEHTQVDYVGTYEIQALLMCMIAICKAISVDTYELSIYGIYKYEEYEEYVPIWDYFNCIFL